MSESSESSQMPVYNVLQAVCAVMKEVPYVKKDKATGLNYTFLSESSLIEKLNPEMSRVGLMVIPIKMDYESGSYTTSSGKTAFRTIVKVNYLACTPSDTQGIVIETIGEASDHGDKSAAKAMTIARKYALRQLFNIETGDDPDRTPSSDVEPEGKQTVKGQGNNQQQGQKPPANNGNGNNGNGKPPANNGNQMTPTDRFAKRCAMIPAVTDLKKLNEFREKYTADKEMDKNQVATLEQLYWMTEAKIKSQLAKDAPPSTEDNDPQV